MFHRRFLLGFSLACAAIGAPANAQDWQQLLQTPDDIAFVDVQSVRALPPVPIYRDFEVREIWVKYEPYQSHRSTYMFLYRVNCSDNTMFDRSIIEYNSTGRVADSRTNEDMDFRYEPVPPGSAGIAIVDFVCGRRSLLDQ